MAVQSPYQVSLAADERSELESLSRRASAQSRQVLRARIVLAAADGASNAAIAERLDICLDTIRKWRMRFCRSRFEGLRDLPRSGRPRTFTAEVVAEIKALACELPTRVGVPLTRWSCPELAREAMTRGITDAISASTVRRWLATDAIKPWQYRSWIFPRDPHFASKAARALDLYARIYDGEPLGEDDYVLSADEKPGVQARQRKQPNLPPDAHRPMRVESTWHAGVLRRLRRPLCPRDRSLRTHHRHRTLHPTGGPGDDHRTVRKRASCVLDCR
ncbi:helix-turn-helix domain-containing protein [Rhodococcus sp. ARC_M6]|uniref:helix-turn-helix domain-containing protein n=1 Tax=Rhodococcus sp. ARC_M6 TaxID=2928852 RepID=UPI001FB1F90D|nr:helix-turn-helix domain-containing protein [Rhodococcus sp. ARC_M6]MCJ0907274.1 helix-turn-helix domain-containing protein [Rhodococcus sp. ARC_M6]